MVVVVPNCATREFGIHFQHPPLPGYLTVLYTVIHCKCCKADHGDYAKGRHTDGSFVPQGFLGVLIGEDFVFPPHFRGRGAPIAFQNLPFRCFSYDNSVGFVIEFLSSLIHRRGASRQRDRDHRCNTQCLSIRRFPPPCIRIVVGGCQSALAVSPPFQWQSLRSICCP
jgi:hypothetical protein